MKSIDGEMLKKMLISGANNLYNHYPEVDALNVFPVPDGDTGINMNLTLSSGAKEISNRSDQSAGIIATIFSRGLLMGARGNSGVITSQIFRGFAQYIKEKEEINAIDLADAFVNGKDVAYKAVMRPVEGTILTVIREAAFVMQEQAKPNQSIEDSMSILLKEAKDSLKRTPELLPLLKEAHVVDSGGAGLVYIIEGMLAAVEGNFINKSEALVEEASKKALSSEEKQGYQVEFILNTSLNKESKKQFLEKRFISVLESHAENVKVSVEDDEIKVHLETETPGHIITYAHNFGEFNMIKIQNLQKDLQKEESLDLDAKKELDEYAIVATSVGKGLDQLFKDLGVTIIVNGGQTMNPSTEDFIAAIKKANAHHVFVLPNNSNIVMAASQACDVIDDEGVEAMVIPSKTIPQGIIATMMFNPGVSFDENFMEMKNALKSVKSGSITYSIKDTEIDGVHITKNHFMEIFDGKIIGCEKSRASALENLIASLIDENSSVATIIFGEDASEEEANKVAKKLEKRFPEVEFDIREGNQPVYAYYVGVE